MSLPSPSSPTGPGSNRLVSLDAFRGAAIASMILVNNPGSWGHIYAQLEHSVWNGWTFTDTVFPFFLWIAGVAIALSRPSAPRAIRRFLLLLAVAYLLAQFPKFAFHYIRIPGVLQRIAVCSLIATLIHLRCKVRGILIWIASLLAAYWLFMTLYPVPGYGSGDLSVEGNFARYIDGLLLTGHMWSQTKTWDPEGIVSTIPSIATTLFGVLTGIFLKSDTTDKPATMFVAANMLLFAGLIMNIWLPINKSLWTSTFSVFMAGLALLVFATFYYLIDVQGFKRWTYPLVVYGTNAIAAFCFSAMIARLAHPFMVGWLEPKNASLLYAIGNVLAVYAICQVLYWRKWFIRL
jgi:predicted acyltransferase